MAVCLLRYKPACFRVAFALSILWHSDFAAPEDITSDYLYMTSKMYLFKSSSFGVLAVEMNETLN